MHYSIFNIVVVCSIFGSGYSNSLVILLKRYATFSLHEQYVFKQFCLIIVLLLEISITLICNKHIMIFLGKFVSALTFCTVTYITC